MKVTKISLFRLLALSVTALGAMMMATGCADDPTTTVAKDDVKFTLGTVAQFDPDLFGGRGVTELLVNKDNTVAYVKNQNNAIYRINMKDGFKGMKDPKNVQLLNMLNTAAAGTAGQAKLEGENNLAERTLFLTAKGLGVKTGVTRPVGLGASNTGAIAIFEGDDVVPTHAWTSEATHVVGAALTANQTWASFASVMVNNEEYIVVTNFANETSSVKVGANQFTGQHVKAPGFATAPKIIAAPEGTDEIYFISNSGVAVLEKSKLGANNAIAAETADAAADKLQIATGVDNKSIKFALLHNGKVYIALTEAGGNTGGIGVYDIAKKAITAPVASWNSRDVASLTVTSDGKLKAVYSGSWYDVQDDGSLGDATFSLTKIAENKFSSKLLSIGEEIKGRTLYLLQNPAPTDLVAVVSIGNDLLFRGAWSNLFSLTHEDKTVGAAKKETTTQQ